MSRLDTGPRRGSCRLRRLRRKSWFGFAPGRTRTYDVEFPAVPGTAQDLAVAAVPIDPWLGGFDETDQSSLGKIAALMRAAVEQGEQFAVDVEDHDGAAVAIDQLTAAGRHAPRPRDHVLSHAASP